MRKPIRTLALLLAGAALAVLSTADQVALAGYRPPA
jgi:hypothetical protein